MSAGTTGTRTDVHYPVGILHHLLVVLHHNDRVAYVAQRLQGGYQAAVVLLVKAYGGFVQDVEHVHQLRAYLCGKSYALALSAT